MWRFRLLVVAVIVPILVASHRYVRPLPMGTTFEGVTGNSTTSESVVNCVDAWAANPPIALVFNEKTKSCTAFEKVYGIKEAPADERGYRVTVLDEDICFKSAMEDIEKIYDPKCRGGWKEVSFLSTTACYLVIEKAGANYTEETRFNVCEDLYPYSKAASIHSAEENTALYQKLEKISIRWFNLPLNLTNPTQYSDMNAWKWLDGTTLDYNNFKPTHLTSHCSPGACKNAFVSSGSIWHGAHSNLKGNILCKYSLN